MTMPVYDPTPFYPSYITPHPALTIEQLRQLIPILVNLAERHVAYNVKSRHYSTVGLAIIMTLARTLGSDCDVQTKAAWIELWSLMCTVMIPAHVRQAQMLGVEI